MRMHNPPHPGKVLREFLGGLDVTTAAKHLPGAPSFAFF
jgi:plasmid maintenance system antidote protein VapI